ncbi:MAG TPA: TerC family protein, partial [Nitrospiria bacterium]
MIELLTSPEAWVAFATLTALEIVLGIDNILFLSILVGKLPAERQGTARFIGLFLAMFMRIALLLSIAWIIGMTEPLFSALGQEISVRDLILFAGGLFLLYKGTAEIHEALEGVEGKSREATRATFSGVIFQIILIDIVFSLDSVITAVGLVEHIPIMVAAIVVAVLVMMVSAAAVSDFVNRHPTIKMLALSFLILIGVTLVADSLEFHIP